LAISTGPARRPLSFFPKLPRRGKRTDHPSIDGRETEGN
jgi:hypothetical protein